MKEPLKTLLRTLPHHLMSLGMALNGGNIFEPTCASPTYPPTH